ncbi:hypothetical protein Dvina_16445 [Dactylosporangium vinaceum]|uniref:Uncharacterized protein n=1 Tax=Dactylosporangium vinaceum TaxID=53362 RepID=A0ABV5M9D0_9ACTN|nr:hypothetical protein [Dactylosporangium vinaceum]UAB99513.1 hypothetical protein Dvina_16445 [Dactylosporangium vinaceum]
MIDLDRYAGPVPADGPASAWRRPAARLAVVAALALVAGVPAAPPRAYSLGRTAPAPINCGVAAFQGITVLSGDAYHVLNPGPVGVHRRCPS